MNRKTFPLYVFILLSFFCFGISGMMTGAALPEIIKDFGWSYAQSGLILTSTSLSFFITAIFAGRLLAGHNPKYLISAALMLLAASLFFFGSTGNFYVNLILKIFFGLSFGILEVSGNFLVSRMEKEGDSHLMGFLHAAFAVGAIAGPFLLSIFLKYGISWVYVFKIAAFILILLQIYFFFVKLSYKDSDENTDEIRPAFNKIKFNFFSVMSSLILFLYVGYEVGLSDWGSEFIVQTHNLSSSKAASLISVFWTGLFLGRIINPFLFKKFSLQLQLVFFSFLAASGTGFILLNTNKSLLVFAFSLAGYGCASIYPMVMTIIGQFTGKNRSTILGMASACGGLGSLVIPITMSRIANSSGIFAGFAFYFVIAVIQFVAVIIYFYYLLNRKALIRDSV